MCCSGTVTAGEGLAGRHVVGLKLRGRGRSGWRGRVFEVEDGRVRRVGKEWDK